MGSTGSSSHRLKKQASFEIEGVSIPVEVNYERRKNVRISCGVDRLYLRLPAYCSAKETRHFIEWGEEWARQTWARHGWFRERFRPKEYVHGQQISTAYDTFELRLLPSSRANFRGVIKNGIIAIDFPGLFPDDDTHQYLHSLIHKLLAKYYLPFVSEKLHNLNAMHFGKEIRRVRLSLQNTRWGSCSTKGTISLSTKLLFAPEEVMDYVIIHELAHLIEHNHSVRFWDLVAKAMPGYKKQEAWLKKKGHMCD